jgi:hypothetical protein
LLQTTPNTHPAHSGAAAGSNCSQAAAILSHLVGSTTIPHRDTVAGEDKFLQTPGKASVEQLMGNRRMMSLSFAAAKKYHTSHHRAKFFSAGGEKDLCENMFLVQFNKWLPEIAASATGDVLATLFWQLLV